MTVGEVKKKLGHSRLEGSNALGMKEELDGPLVARFGSRDGRRVRGCLLCGGRIGCLDCC